MPTVKKPRTRTRAATTTKANTKAVDPTPDKLPIDPVPEPVAIPEWAHASAQAALAYIQATIPDVRKTGSSSMTGDYFQEHGILELLRPYQFELQLAILAEVEILGINGNLTSATCWVTLIDTKQPPRLDMIANPLYQVGPCQYGIQATDGQGWGAAKAQTYGKKYALQKFFGVPTEALHEAEQDAPKSTATGPTAGSSKVSLADAKALFEQAEKAGVSGEWVTAQLQAHHGVSKISDLSVEGAQKFGLALTEKIKSG